MKPGHIFLAGSAMTLPVTEAGGTKRNRERGMLYFFWGSLLEFLSGKRQFMLMVIMYMYVYKVYQEVVWIFKKFRNTIL